MVGVERVCTDTQTSITMKFLNEDWILFHSYMGPWFCLFFFSIVFLLLLLLLMLHPLPSYNTQHNRPLQKKEKKATSNHHPISPHDMSAEKRIKYTDIDKD